MKDELKPKLWRRIWVNRLRWVYFLSSLVTLVAAWFLGQVWTMDRSNVAVTVGVIALIVGSGILIYRGWRANRDIETVITGQDKAKGPANSLNIYVIKDEETSRIIPEKIAFELVNQKGEVITNPATLEQGEHPPGQPWQCLNDGNWYYLNYLDLDKAALRSFILPDSQYFDPAEFANVITMPAHKKLFMQRQSLFQKLAPGLMLIGFIASGFFCLVMGG